VAPITIRPSFGKDHLSGTTAGSTTWMSAPSFTGALRCPKRGIHSQQNRNTWDSAPLFVCKLACKITAVRFNLDWSPSSSLARVVYDNFGVSTI
jgi:hypothetical protein